MSDSPSIILVPYSIRVYELVSQQASPGAELNRSLFFQIPGEPDHIYSVIEVQSVIGQKSWFGLRGEEILYSDSLEVESAIKAMFPEHEQGWIRRSFIEAWDQKEF